MTLSALADTFPTMITVGRYLNPVDAQLDRIKLEQANIRSVIHAGAEFNPLIMGAGGETRLEVDEGDADQAREILRRVDHAPPEDEDPAVVRCPACDGTYCYFEAHRSDVPIPDAIVAITDTISESMKRWACRTCSHRWDDPHEAARLGRVDTSLPSPVFRLRRSSWLMGGLVGLMVGFVIAVMVGDGPAGGAVLLLGIVAGCLFGRSMTTDTCSQPGCGEQLSSGQESCRACGGIVSGVITSALEHHRQATEVRRALMLELENDSSERATKRRRGRPKRARLEAESRSK